MTHAFIAAAAAFIASPALATGGFDCSPLEGSGPTLNLIVGHTVSPRSVGATLRLGAKTVPTEIGQSWIDERHLWVDLVDPQAMRFEVKLRAAFQPKLKGRPAIGTLERDGRTWRVPCVEA